MSSANGNSVEVRRFAASRSAGCRRGPRRKMRFRPLIDEMECRTLLSTWTVTSPSDAGAGTLRQAISDAAGGDTIQFDGSLAGTPIGLASELVINKSLDIEGLEPGLLTINGNAAGRVFDITTPGSNVTLAHMTITGGLASEGGGILDQGGNLTVVDSQVMNNNAIGTPGATGSSGGDGLGGGIALEGGSLSVVASMISGNVAQGGAGGAGQAGANHTSGGVGDAGGSGGNGGRGLGGAIYDAGGQVSITQSAVSGNQALGGAGGTGGAGGIGSWPVGSNPGGEVPVVLVGVAGSAPGAPCITTRIPRR
jgi:hypothetical protein